MAGTPPWVSLCTTEQAVWALSLNVQLQASLCHLKLVTAGLPPFLL